MKTVELFLLFLLLNGCAKETPGIHPGLTTITEAVYGTATVVPNEAYTVFSSVNGIIERSHLVEGALIEENDELFRISTDRAQLARKKATQNLARARESYRGDAAILKEMEDRLQSAAMSLTQDSLNYRRQGRLWRQNIGSKQAFEMTELKYKTTRSQIDELHRAYARTQRELADQFDLAGTDLEISGQQYAEYVTHAKMGGTVYEVLVREGESVTTQTPVARIGSTDDFILELLIDEVDIPKVLIGQNVVVILDAYRDEPYKAVITRILPHKDDRSQTFTVEASFTKSPKQLYDGLSGEANVIISRRENTLILPTEFIGPDNQVFTADGAQSVVTGISDLRYTEIISGLDTNALVYQPE
ncbi:efflux RND transporter periplasmic adaptor subunit [Neolewinella antarctica]|uniref:HlyD family secretion protein n=1 Tax=Neolewinella antarctica TaxID=442734 RepID=A0ABX0X8U6_9BACT|nr:HlyD family efflux transporter periplasmic adaptor subunit [Neolewinella antarctica]NJC25597.1 HlyD family secretion protein [Neolewinella antarctica]